MASDVLSQHEIDSLLGGGSTGAGGAGAAGGAGRGAAASREADIQVYDFRRPHRVSKERLRTLEAMYERLVKSLEIWLIGRVRDQVELRLQSVEQFSFGEFALSLSSPCSAYVCDIAGVEGQNGVIDFGQEFAYFLIDRLFGGGGTPTYLTRALTPLERSAVRVVADRVAALLQEIWQDHVQLGLTVSGFESSPEILQAGNREDPVVVANVEVSAGQASSLLILCLPLAAVEKFFDTSGKRRVNPVAGSERERAENRQLTESSLRATRVSVTARLPEFRVSMRELTDLKPGSVISTGVARDAPLRILVGGQERFQGTVGRVGRRLGAHITDATNTDAG